jgi:ABC-2 type transport system permease protein
MSTTLPVRYIALETSRQLRNARAVVFTFAIPVVMLLIFGGTYGGSGEIDPLTKLPVLVETTIQMAAYGGMMAALSQAFSMVNERASGWNRQLRVTPLSGAGFLASKMIAALALAAVSIALVTVVSIVALHTSLPVGRWVLADFGLWCGVIPFALIAILIGQYAKPSFAQPLFMVVFLGLAILGGLWVPLSVMPSWMGHVARVIPSYWLNRLGAMGAGQSGDLLSPVLVLIAWALVLGAVVVWRYRRDAERQ